MIKRCAAAAAIGFLTACSSGSSSTSLLPLSGAVVAPASRAHELAPSGFAQVTYPAQILADGPTGYYHLNDAGLGAFDSSGHDHSGRATATSTGVIRQTENLLAGYDSTATTFTGNALGDIGVARSAAFEQAQNISVEAWVRLAAKGPGRYETVVAYGNAGYGLDFDEFANVFRFKLALASQTLSIESTAIPAAPLGNVFHLVGTYDGSTADLYVNGSLAASAPASGAVAFDPQSDKKGLVIGNSALLVSPAYASVQEVAVYPVALSAARIALHYAVGSSGVPTPTPTPSGSPSPLPTATPTPTPTATPTPTGKLLPPPGTIYLGARVDPSGGPYDQADVGALESQIGRTLALDTHYHNWGDAWPGSQEADDLAHHRIPVVAWNCGAFDYDVALAGSAGPNAAAINAQIDQTAAAVKAYGAPIMIRWFWEMNLSSSDQQRSACWDAAHDLTVGSTQYFNPTWYAAAFDYIVARFAADAVTNVVWVWCPSGGGGGQPLAPYYPGDAFVDWMSFDSYALAPDSLAATLDGPYAAVTTINPAKPILVAETATLPSNQAAWLTGANSVLQTTFPDIKGFMYFDATGPRADWAFSPTGLAAFTQVAQTPYLSAP